LKQITLVQMLDPNFEPGSPRHRAFQPTANRFLIGRSDQASPASSGDKSPLGSLRGQPIIAETRPYMPSAVPRLAPTFTETDALQARAAETAAPRKPAPIRFLQNLPRMSLKPAPEKFNVAAARNAAKRLQRRRERLGQRNQVLDEHGEPVPVSLTWLSSFLTIF
jgi:hypothetical protein